MAEIKHVAFERSGGFAGIRFAADFELDELPDDQARQLKELFDNLDFDKLPSQLNQNGNMADGFTYVVTVTSDKGTHTVTASDTSAPEKIQSLFELLVKIAKQKAKKQQ